MLRAEAIRLGSQQEQSHGRIIAGLAVAATHDRRHADAQAVGEDAESLPALGAVVCRLCRALARHRHGRGSARLPVALGGSRYLAGVAQYRDHRPEVLLRGHARSGRVDGEDATGAGTADAAGGVESGGGRAPDRSGAQPEGPDGAVGGLRHRPPRERGGGAEGHRHRQSAHDAARRAGQGAQGSLRHAAAPAARTAAHLVAGRPGAGEDARRRVVVPRHESARWSRRSTSA